MVTFFKMVLSLVLTTVFTRGNFFRPYILTMQVGRKIYMTKMKLMKIFFSWMVCWFFISSHAFMEHIVQKLHLNYCSKRNCWCAGFFILFKTSHVRSKFQHTSPALPIIKLLPFFFFFFLQWIGSHFKFSYP